MWKKSISGKYPLLITKWSMQESLFGWEKEETRKAQGQVCSIPRVALRGLRALPPSVAVAAQIPATLPVWIRACTNTRVSQHLERRVKVTMTMTGVLKRSIINSICVQIGLCYILIYLHLHVYIYISCKQPWADGPYSLATGCRASPLRSPTPSSSVPCPPAATMSVGCFRSEFLEKRKKEKKLPVFTSY